MKRLFGFSLIAVSVVATGCGNTGTSQGTGNGLPPRPDSGTSSRDDAVEATFGLRDVFLHAGGEQAGRIGLNVDELDTTEAAITECTTPSGVPVPLDTTDGIDNSVGSPSVMGLVNLALPCLEDDIALAQGTGLGTILLRVRKWNGEANDASVEVAIAQAVAGTVANPADLTPEYVYLPGHPMAGEPAPPPAWAGDDSWFVDKDDFIGDDLDNPKNVQTNAYIADGRLVVPLIPTAPIELFMGAVSHEIQVDPEPAPPVLSVGNQGLRLQLGDGYLFGDINEAGTEIVRGAIAGRISISDLLEATPKVGICDSLNQVGQQASFETNADLMRIAGTGGPTATCDALSLGIAFTGISGTIANFGPGTLEVTFTCPDVPNDALPKPNRCCPGAADTSYYQNFCGSAETRAETDRDPQVYQDFMSASSTVIPVPVADF